MSRPVALGVRGRQQLAVPLLGEQGTQRRAVSSRRSHGHLPGHATTRATASGRREACPGGAGESLDAAITALLDGASTECLLCGGDVVRRMEEVTLVCSVCGSTLGPLPDSGASVQLQAA